MNGTKRKLQTLTMNPKITLIGTLPPIKGISPYCQELLKSLSKRIGVEFIGFRKLYPDFLYPGGTKVKDRNYKVPQVKNAKIKNILTYYNPLIWIWAGLSAKGDIIHAQWWSHVLAPIYFVILLICKIRRKKILITVHNVIPHENNKMNNFLNKTILVFGDKFITHTERNKENLSNFYDIPKDKISVIPHGILKSILIKNISKKEARKYLKIPQSSKVILYFGNIRDYKGLDILIQSLKFIIKEIKDTILIIAGKSWIDWNKYKEIIKKYGLQDHIVKKLDFILPSQIEYYFSASDIIVLPYKYFDSQSGVGALALSFKKPLIVTNVGGLPDFVKDKRAVAKPNDPQDLAKKIIQVLKDKNLIRKLSKDSEELTKKYNWDEIGEKILRLYKELM